MLDLYVISLGRCYVVLGVQWLRTLGSILWDFDKLYMQFTKRSQTFCITNPDSGTYQIQDISTLQMQKLLQQETTIGAVLYQMECVEENLLQLDVELLDRNSQDLTDTQLQQLHALFGRI